MRARWALGLTTAIAVLVLSSAGVASATPPVTLSTGYVFDDVDALSAAEESQAQIRLDQLKSDTGLDLWVVYVDEFTNPSSAEDWASRGKPFFAVLINPERNLALPDLYRET